MPHNMYLHSALVQTRHIGHDEGAKRAACRYNLIDSVVALNGAMFVNVAILVMSAAVFFKRGIVVTEIQQAHRLLAPLLDAGIAGVIFAIALICSGPILHAHRNPGRPSGDGRLSSTSACGPGCGG